MKKTGLFLLVFLFITNCYSQSLFEKKSIGIDASSIQPINLSQQKNVAATNKISAAGLSYDCSTVFWTVNTNGDIQQWNLSANQVTGGAIVQSNCGNSVAFCGSSGAINFYSTNYPSTGILKYDFNLGWVTIPTTMALLNNGGFQEDQYYYNFNGSSFQDLYHFDGTNLNLIEHLSGSTTFGTADVAVDSKRRAWVFTGPSIGFVDTLRIYDSNGLVASYPFNYVGWDTYGSFFIDDQLYFGIGNSSMALTPNSIVPINFDGANVTIGTSIPFSSNNGSYRDMASCNKITNLNTQSNHFNNGLIIYPNPAHDLVAINLDESIQSVAIYSLEGKLIKTFENNKLIDISDLENNMYLLKIISENNVYNRFIIKN